MIFIQPSIDPVIFSLGILEVRWYSLSYIIAFVFGSILIKKINTASYNLITDRQIDSFFIWSVIGVIIGGRIGYVLFYQTELLISYPLYMFQIWKGGMSFHGGLLGMIISIYFYCKKYNLSFFYLSDLISIVAPIGLFFGRIANFINTELYGRVTDFKLAIIYPTIDEKPRHPSQLYEAFFEGLILFIVLLLYFIKNKKKYKVGNISAFFLILYSFFRYFIEYLREPDYQLGLYFHHLSMGQILCIPLIVFGILIYYRK